MSSRFVASSTLLRRWAFAFSKMKIDLYLVRHGLFADEILESIGGLKNFDLFLELDELIRKQDDMINECTASWVEDWFDAGCRGYLELEDFVQSQEDLLTFIPEGKNLRIRKSAERALQILRGESGVKVGDPVEIKTDKAYKYHGFRFYVKAIGPSGDVLVGRKKDDLVDICYDKGCVRTGLRVVPAGQNKAVYD